MNAFWEITKKDLEDKKAELRNKDREMEEMEERHQVEIKVRAGENPRPSTIAQKQILPKEPTPQGSVRKDLHGCGAAPGVD